MRHWWIGLTAALLVAATPAITRWQVQPASSAIGFSVSGGGQTAEGCFARYVARIRFDPDRLSQSSAIVAIDLGSVGTGQKAVDETLRSAEWFDVASHPQALFTASRFERLGNNRYAAHGQLKMRGRAVPVTLPFTLAISGGEADVAGRLVIDRTRWGIGTADNMANDQVGKEVTITVKVKALALDGTQS